MPATSHGKNASTGQSATEEGLLIDEAEQRHQGGATDTAA
jgi:hypothetical protein